MQKCASIVYEDQRRGHRESARSGDADDGEGADESDEPVEGQITG